MTEKFINYKKKRNKFTYKEKKEIITNYEASGYNAYKFANHINIKPRTLQKWIASKEKIFSIENDNQTRKGSGDKPLIPIEIELKILEWFLDVRYSGVPISDVLIKIRGEFLLKQNNPLLNCKFSNGWLARFKKRYNICKRRGGSKIVRIDDSALNIIINFIEDIRIKIINGNYDSIINIDETGIYYDSQVNYTLDIKGTKRVEIISTGREHQRITVVLGIDLLNNINVKPFIILKGKTKRSLKDININDDYNLSFQKNAWCTEDQFINFLSNFPKDKKILLLLDNFKGHKTKKVLDFLKSEYPLHANPKFGPTSTSKHNINFTTIRCWN